MVGPPWPGRCWRTSHVISCNYPRSSPFTDDGPEAEEVKSTAQSHVLAGDTFRISTQLFLVPKPMLFRVLPLPPLCLHSHRCRAGKPSSGSQPAHSPQSAPCSCTQGAGVAPPSASASQTGPGPQPAGGGRREQ